MTETQEVRELQFWSEGSLQMKGTKGMKESQGCAKLRDPGDQPAARRLENCSMESKVATVTSESRQFCLKGSLEVKGAQGVKVSQWFAKRQAPPGAKPTARRPRVGNCLKR